MGSTVRSARIAAAVVWCAALASASCESVPERPLLVSVTPGCGPSNAVTAIAIHGSGFGARVITNFNEPSNSHVDATYRAFVGEHALRGVVRIGETELNAEVAAGIPPGVYDLEIEDPWGRRAALAHSFEVLDSSVPVALDLAGPAQTLTVGDCSAPVLLLFRDASGNATTARQDTVATLSAAPPEGFSFFSDATCTTSIDRVSVARGDGSTSFYVSGVRAGTVTLSVTAVDLSIATQDVALEPQSPSALGFPQVSLSCVSGECSPPVSVELEDAFGNAVAASVPVAVTLTADPATGTAFYADAACTLGTSATTIPAGETLGTFHFRGVLPGAFTVTAAATGLTSARQDHSVAAAAPEILFFTTPSQVLTTGECSSVVTVETRDATGFVSAVGALTPVQLSADPAGGFVFYGDSLCTGPIETVGIAAGTSSSNFYMSGTVAGSVTITAAAATLVSDMQQQLIMPSAATAMVFASAPQNVVEGVCSGPAMVELNDAHGNIAPAAAPTTLSLSATPASGFAFYIDPSCAAGTTTVALGTGESSTTFYFSSTTVGDVTLNAAGTGLLASQTETIRTAVGPRSLGLPVAPTPITAGVCSSVATVETLDASGAPITVTNPVQVLLSAAPAAGFGFYADPACGTAVSNLIITTGTSSTDFYYKGTIAGSTTASVSANGLTGASVSTTIVAGQADELAFDPVTSPQVQDATFGVTIRALDAYGNLDALFAGQADLTLAPAGTLTCASGCATGATTTAFAAGVWNGNVAVTTIGTGLSLFASSGTSAGTSNPFDVQGAPTVDTPPLARLAFDRAVILEGDTVTFDASGSSDYETPTSTLEVSWDPVGDAVGSAPWTAWTTTKTLAQTYATAGTYAPRLAVRDSTGNTAYATGTIVVIAVASAADFCTVDTASAADDGAASCAGPFGADGKLSLVEALRLSDATAGSQVITFTTPLSLSSPALGGVRYTQFDTLTLVAPPGVVLNGYALRTEAGGLIAGVEITGVDHTTRSGGGTLTVRDVYIHDARGLVADTAPLIAERVRALRCGADWRGCLRAGGAGLLTVRDSLVSDSPWAAVELGPCGFTAADVQSTVFAQNPYGIYVSTGFNSCTGKLLVVNNTFDGNGTGIRYNGSTSTWGHVLQNNIFTNHSVTAVTCGWAHFTTRSYHELYQNASNGCLGNDWGTLTSNPDYVLPAANDYRLSSTSPARDSGAAVTRDLNGPAPGTYFGTAPDRGGCETW